jgi:Tripartite tricarboxylate transporter family receptor/Transposase IS116/IS110/IS902 family
LPSRRTVARLLAEMREPGVLRWSSEVVAYAGLNPSHHRSGTSIDRPSFAAAAWFGLLAPAGTPPAVVERAHRAAVAAQRAPELQQRLQELGILMKE